MFKFFEQYCDWLQLLVNLHVKLFCFWTLVQKSYISSHHFAEQLCTVVEHLSKASSVFYKAKKNFKNHPE